MSDNSFNKTFIDDCLNSKTTLDKLDEYVDYWHNHCMGKSLQDFLGMTTSEYELWGKSPDSAIFDIIQRRKEAMARLREDRLLYRGFSPCENGQKVITVNGTEIKGDWVEGYMFNKNIIIPSGQFIRLSKYGDKNVITSDSALEFYSVIPETVCQHTGVKNAFEFDLIKHHFGNEVGVIRYGPYRNPFNDDKFAEHIGFYVDWIAGEDKKVLRKDLGYWLAVTEIAGNIFENSNFTKKET